MAVSFWPPKVIVILTVCGISGAYDDLINRIRVSKSDDPEVTDFINSVLKHQADFQWIQSRSQNHLDHMLPLNGLPLKSKRSFYSSRGGYPAYRYYGYKMPQRYSSFRPTNDAYPYEDENEAQFNNDPRRTYRDLDDAGYDYNENESDFLSNEEPDVEMQNFVSDDASLIREKRDREAMRQVPENDYVASRSHKPKIYYDHSGLSHAVDFKGEKIRVIPNGESGFLNAPGLKYNYKGDDRKRCVDDIVTHELLGIDDMAKTNVSVESPMGEFYYSGPHDILGISQEHQDQYQSTAGTKPANYTCKKLKRGERIKRAIRLEEFLSHPGRRTRKNDKAIKIKIFDDGRLVKDIKKGESNSIVLTIKNDKSKSIISPVDKSYTNLLSNIKSDEAISKLLSSDDTLQKIDTIIQKDQESLKQNSQFISNSPKIKKDSPSLLKDMSDDYKPSDQSDSNTPKKSKKIGYQRINEMGTRLESVSGDPDTIDSDTDNSFEYRLRPYQPYEFSTILQEEKMSRNVERQLTSRPRKFEEQFIFKPVEATQNRLEDQSEPTSAAEQRELGKINNTFSTPSMDVLASEKMLIIPFRKSTEKYETSDDDYYPENKFSVKDSHDMIHNKMHEKRNDKNEASNTYEKRSDNKNNDIPAASVLIHNSLKEANDVIDHLKEQISKSMKNEYSQNKPKRLTQDYEAFDDDPGNDEVGHKPADEEYEMKGAPDDNIELPKSTPSSPAALKKKKNAKPSLKINLEDDSENDNTLDDTGARRSKYEVYTFKKRQLKSVDEYADFADKKNLRDFFGMTNDQDYSEDKIDFEENDLKKRSETDDKLHKAKMYANKFLYKKNGKDFKDKLVKSDEKFHSSISDEHKKVKKDASNKKLNIFTERLDIIKRENSQDDTSVDATDTDTPDKNEDQAPPSGGNELDIIEKTQAILLHITQPPVSKETSCDTQGKGEFDDNDDPNSKVIENSSENRNGMNVKHSNIVRVQHLDQGDDLVGEIMQLVKNYKENERRKKAKHDHRAHRYLDYDDDDVGFSHHLHKDKKAHPKSMHSNVCKVKIGTDRNLKNYHTKRTETEYPYSAPKAVKEAYFEPETIVNAYDKQNLSPDYIDEREPNKISTDSDNDGLRRKRHMEDEQYLGENIYNDPARARKFHNEVSSLKDAYTNLMRKDLQSPIDGPQFHVPAQYSQLPPDDNVRVRRFKNFAYNPYYYDTLAQIRQQSDRIANAAVHKKQLHKQRQAAETTSATTGASTAGSTEAGSKASSETTAAAAEASSSSPTAAGSTITSVTDAGGNVTSSTCATSPSTCPSFHNANLKNCMKPDDKIITEYGKVHFNKDHKKKHRKPECDRPNKLKDQNKEKLADDQEDISRKYNEHYKNVLNGHIVLELLDTFQKRIKENPRLNKRFGDAVSKKCAQDQVAQIEQFREEQSKRDIRHAQLMLHQIIVMMNKIVADQVHRRTCIVLPPSVKDFLTKVSHLYSNPKSLNVAEGYPLPQMGEGGACINAEDKQADFLFDDSESNNDAESMKQKTIRRKISLIRRLLHKYDLMSESCQIKVQPIREYLIQHLEMLEKMCREQNLASEDVCPVPQCLAKCGGDMTTCPPAGQTAAGGSTAAKAAEAGISTTGAASSSVGTEKAASSTTAPAAGASVPHEGRSAASNPFMHQYLGKSYANMNHRAGSEKYRKLVDAAETYRRKRQIEERLGHLFGRNRREPETKENKREKQLKDISFESPIVYSLDD